MGLLYIGTNGHVSGIDPRSGDELWRTRLMDGFFSPTSNSDVRVIDKDGVVYAGCSGHLFALDAVTGRILWRNELPGLGHHDVFMSIEGVSVQTPKYVPPDDDNSSMNDD